MSEDKQQGNQIRLEKVFSFAKVGWFEIDYRTDTCNLSPYICEILGVKKDNLSFDEFIASIKDEYRQEIYKLIRFQVQKIGCDVNFVFETEALGSVRFRMNLDKADKNHLSLGYLERIDETKAKIAESRCDDFEILFRMLAGVNKIGYGKLNPVTGEGYADEQWCKNMGDNPVLTSLDAFVSLTFVHPEDREHVLQFYKDAVKGLVLSYEHEIRIFTPAGKFKWVLIKMRAVCDQYSNTCQVYALNYDITDQRHQREELAKAREQVEMMDRLKSAFIANVSHEIRTPLNAIIGFSKLLGEDVAINDRLAYINLIEENNDLLLQLISDILDLSKLEAGTFEFFENEIDIRSLCADIVQGVLFRKSDNINIIFDTPDKEAHVYCDQNRIYQILLHLVNNALKFTKEGTIHIGFEFEKEGLKLYIKDSGIGISKEKIDNIFNRFVKLDIASKGVGIGLALCKSIIEHFGGQIGVDSEIGQGSCFWILFPEERIMQCIEGKWVSRLENKELPSIQVVPRKKYSILIAEDAESNYLLLQAMLSKEFELHWAIDGVKAVEMCRELSPDMILMDIRMPRMDGLEATQKIREFNTSVPILALTAFTMDEEQHDIIEANCDEFLSKPISAKDLKRAMYKWFKTVS